MKAVILVTYEGSPWLEEARDALRNCKYDVLECVNTPEDNAYDPAGLYFAKEQGLDEFILLHDSCIVKDLKVLDMLFDGPGNIAISPSFLMLLGKYQTDNLPELPAKPQTKKQAVDFELGYGRAIPVDRVLFPDFIDGNHTFEHYNDRKNMVLENEYLKKYKGYWSAEQVPND